MRDFYLKAGNTLTQSLRAHVAALLDGGDAECLHQARIGIRRLRALLWCYRWLLRSRKYKALNGELKWLARQFAPARDGEVLRLEVWPLVRACLDSPALIKTLEDAWWSDQQQAVACCCTTLRSVRYRRLMICRASEFGLTHNGVDRSVVPLDTWNEEARRYLRPLVKQLLARVHKGLSDVDDGDTCTLHRLRQAIKRARYTLEMATPRLKKGRVGRLKHALSKRQDRLGDIHDVAIAGRAITARVAATQ